MNLNFFKKNNNQNVQVVNTKNSHNLPDKPYSETGPRPTFLWKILLWTYLSLGFSLFVFIIFSYQFLTRERAGVVENNPNSNPKINASKIEKINSFFDERAKLIESAYKKTVIDPGLN
jgi:hypothetical protein